MAVTKLKNSTAIAALDAIVDLLDAGTGAGKVVIYTGSLPTDLDSVPGGSVLVTSTLNDAAFGGAADDTAGGAVASQSETPAEPSGTATGTGTAGCFIATDSDNNIVLGGDVTATGNGGAMTINNTSIATDQVVTITSWSITLPEY